MTPEDFVNWMRAFFKILESFPDFPHQTFGFPINPDSITNEQRRIIKEKLDEVIS